MFYIYRRNQYFADHGWEVLLIMGKSDEPELSLNQSQKAIQLESPVGSYHSQQSLSPEIGGKSHWVVKYQHMLGNKLWMAKFIVLVMIVFPLSSFMIFVTVHWAENGSFIDSFYNGAEFERILRYCVIVAFTMFVTFMVWFQISKYTDLISIRYELSYICLAVYFWISVIIIWSIIVTEDATLHANETAISRVFDCFMWSLISTIKLAIVVVYVLYKRRKSLKLIKLNQTVARSNNHNNNGKYQAQLTMQQVIGHEFGFRLFSRHLQSEFALENLLYLCGLFVFIFVFFFFFWLLRKK